MQKKIKKKYFIFEIIASEFVARNCLCYADIIFDIIAFEFVVLNCLY